MRVSTLQPNVQLPPPQKQTKKQTNNMNIHRLHASYRTLVTGRIKQGFGYL